MKISALLHNYQPLRSLLDVTWIPLDNRIQGKASNKQLIPYPSGEPAEDWNRKILGECYKPCAQGIHGGNVYSRLPFNFAPTLLLWLYENSRDVYKLIIKSNKESQKRYGNHGNAVAQASWNHAILPLATRDDKEVNIQWSIKDFETHYERAPEGVWLPETAVDLETLSILSEHEVRYVILSPHQASRIRPIGGNEHSWIDVGGGRIDPSKPYKLFLPNEKDIVVFFFDKYVSEDIAFSRDGIYHSSENFIRRLIQAQDQRRQEDQLIHFATDGETFGHHHKDIANVLNGMVNLLDWHGKEKYAAELTNYGFFLEQNPPQWEVNIFENTAWSCFHGLGRWGETGRKDCNCATPDSTWRVELRKALDYLGERIDCIYYRHASKYLQDPENAIKDYISVVLNPKLFHEFFQYHKKNNLFVNDTENVYKLLEMEKFKLLMFTSCGWFHDSVSRIEPFTNLICANSAIQIAKYFKPESRIEEDFLDRLPKDIAEIYLKAAEINKSYFALAA